MGLTSTGGRNCSFTTNSATSQGTIFNEFNGVAVLTVTCSTFTGNSATGYAGGIYNDSDISPTISHCAFTNNSVTGDFGRGGAIFSNAPLTLESCSFTNNSSSGEGGAVYNNEGAFTLDNCSFTGNSVARDGGAVFNDGTTFTLDNCSFTHNCAPENGALPPMMEVLSQSTTALFTNNSRRVKALRRLSLFTRTNCPDAMQLRLFGQFSE